MARQKKAEGEKYIRQDISMEPDQFRRLMACLLYTSTEKPV